MTTVTASFPPPPVPAAADADRRRASPSPAALRSTRRRRRLCLPLTAACSVAITRHSPGLFFTGAGEDPLPEPLDVASYVSFISSLAKSGNGRSAVRLFVRMLLSGIEPNGFALVAVLTACIRLADCQIGAQIHALAVKSSYVCCVYVLNSVMAVYVKCGQILDAVKVFDTMLERDVVSFNTLISGLVQDLDFDRAFELFRDMVVEGVRLDHFSFSSLISAAAELSLLNTGKEAHAHGVRLGYEANLSVNNALIKFYSECGKLEQVVGIFERMVTRDVISWTEMVDAYMEFGLVQSAVDVFDQMPSRNGVVYNTLLSGFCGNGKGLEALELFCRMIEDGVEISDFTLTSVLAACALVSDIRACVKLHAFVTKVGFGSNSRIETALLDMYTRCGKMKDARKAFERWVDDQSRSIAWTLMICGYAQNGQPEEAFSLVCKEPEVTMDEVAYATVLGLCATLGFTKKGEQIHCLAIKSGYFDDLAVGNAAIGMYSKCGDLRSAEKVFHLMANRDVISWNALISGQLLHRKGEAALNTWAWMEEDKMANPNAITFALIISACRHLESLDAVDACRRYFLCMRKEYELEPTSEHYASMIHVFGYWNDFEEAQKLIKNMPFKPDTLVWRALLDSSRLRSKLELGKKAANNLLSMEPRDTSMYILQSNLYSASGIWHCSEKVREEMRSKGLRKHPARSWLIHGNHIHSFHARDRSHFQTKDIYSGLEILILECLKAGYEPDTKFVLQDVDECQKKGFLMYHSSKLAVTYGVLVAAPGRPVRVMKNVQLCGDCHSFMKYVSITTGREISVRDSTGFHHFKGSECSCGDYW